VRVVYVYINFIFILVIMQVYRDYLSRGAHRYSSLLADRQVHNVPTHPAPFWVFIACSHWFLGGGGMLLVLTRLLGVCARVVGFYGLLYILCFQLLPTSGGVGKILVSAFPGCC
jgi:hypothetical protein